MISLRRFSFVLLYSRSCVFMFLPFKVKPEFIEFFGGFRSKLFELFGGRNGFRAAEGEFEARGVGNNGGVV